MKTIGIACNNYKLLKFEAELKDKGLNKYTTSIFKESVVLIKITCEEKEIPKIAKICESVESFFKAQNN